MQRNQRPDRRVCETARGTEKKSGEGDRSDSQITRIAGHSLDVKPRMLQDAAGSQVGHVVKAVHVERSQIANRAEENASRLQHAMNFMRHDVRIANML